MVVALLLAVPGLHSVAARLTDAEPAWVIAGTILELLSCLSYVILFQGVFWRGPRALTARIAGSELGANSLVSMGGAGGIGTVESGLVGMLMLYGVHAGPAVAAVLVFCTISMWIPGCSARWPS